MTEWISVEDKLPEDTKLKVIKYGKNGVHVGIGLSFYYSPENLPNKYVWAFEFGNTQGAKVTHWFSLPK
jgi:hypothetical protein